MKRKATVGGWSRMFGWSGLVFSNKQNNRILGHGIKTKLGFQDFAANSF